MLVVVVSALQDGRGLQTYRSIVIIEEVKKRDECTYLVPNHCWQRWKPGIRCSAIRRLLPNERRLLAWKVPNEVVNLAFERGMTPMAAWREHFNLTQAELAVRIGITQAAYAQMEHVKQPRKATLEKVAVSLGIEVEQLRW